MDRAALREATTRLAASESSRLDAEVLLRGMMNKARLLDVVENFILFDTSKPEMRKVVARNQQVLGVNRAVEAVRRQESIKAELRKQRQPLFRLVDVPCSLAADLKSTILSFCWDKNFLFEYSSEG